MKKKVFSFVLAASLSVVAFGSFFSANAVEQEPANDWDNVFDGNGCTGSGAYCWGG